MPGRLVDALTGISVAGDLACCTLIGPLLRIRIAHLAVFQHKRRAIAAIGHAQAFRHITNASNINCRGVRHHSRRLAPDGRKNNARKQTR